MQRHLYEHFQLPVHTGFLQDSYVTLIDKIDPWHPSSVKTRTFEAKPPMGLNV